MWRRVSADLPAALKCNQLRACTGLLYNSGMAIETTYTSLRENLASVLDQVTNDNDVVIVRRRGAEDVALLPARELSSLMETAHLMRSPRNAQRLMKAIERSKRAQGKRMTIEALRREVGLDEGR